MFRKSILRTRPTNPIVAVTTTPTFEIHNVRDTADKGTLLRFMASSRGIRMIASPQIGPRKTEPEDTRPQFDLSMRCTTFLTPKDIASFLCVFQKKLPAFNIDGEYRNLSLSCVPEEKDTFCLKGVITRTGGDKQMIDVTISKWVLTNLEQFFESSIVEGFGFRQYYNPSDIIKEKVQNFESGISRRRNQGRRFSSASERSGNNNNEGNSYNNKNRMNNRSNNRKTNQTNNNDKKTSEANTVSLDDF
eukprot:Tbor_TRINITY_DN4774_c0_g1::TRINITY_DN4774_c0_g1_i1::g.17116::m.17116